MTGHYRMHRGWMDNPALTAANEPYCRRAAWAWLIEKAQWKAAKVNVGGKTVTVERGQLSYSFRYLAGVWNWSLGKVQSFISRLETDAMINTASNTGRLLITICNYELYQAGAEVPNTARDTRPIHPQYESKEGKEGYKKGEVRGSVDSNPPPARAPEPPPPPRPPDHAPSQSVNVIPIGRPARELRPCDPGWTLPPEWQAWAMSLNHPSAEIAGRRFKQHWRLRDKRCRAMSLEDLRESWEVWILEDLKREHGNGGGHHGSESERLRNGLARAFGDCMDPGPEGSSGSGGGVAFRRR